MERDDSILLSTRIVAAIIVPVLVLAVIMLYFLPGDTDRHWAWTISPELTAMYMGAGYASGAYFFGRVFFSRSWSSVGLGFLPITTFTIFMFLATVLHWSRFEHSHVSFWIWTFLYVVTPVLVPALWVMNRRTDPGRKEGKLRIPLPARGVLAIAGAALMALALVMMISPSTVMDDWLWPLSELTARVVAAFIILTGGLLVGMALDSRWSAARIMVETFVLGTALMLIAIVRDWGSLDPSEAVRWGYFTSVLTGLILLAGFYGWMESQARKTEPVAAESEPAG
jgi:hypothetical protein